MQGTYFTYTTAPAGPIQPAGAAFYGEEGLFEYFKYHGLRRGGIVRMALRVRQVFTTAPAGPVRPAGAAFYDGASRKRQRLLTTAAAGPVRPAGAAFYATVYSYTQLLLEDPRNLGTSEAERSGDSLE